MNVSVVSATCLYVTGLVVGSMFGFVAGVLFLAVAILLKKVFSDKEKTLDSINHSSDQTADQNNNASQDAPFTA